MKRMAHILAVVALATTLLAGCPGFLGFLLSDDATLKTLTVAGADLNPVFAAGTHDYAVNVPYEATEVTVAAVATESDALISIGYVAGAIREMTLVEGANTIPVVVVAPNGSDSVTYNLTITRGPKSADADLEALALSGITISPAFSPSVIAYTATVPNAVSTTTVTAVAWEDGDATVTINGDANAVEALAVGATPIAIVVTAPNGTTQKTYTVTVTRQPLSNDANLQALSLSSMEIAPVFAAGTFAYSAVVPYATTSTVVTAVPLVSGATLTINGDTNATEPLAVGANTITIVVTALNTTTTATYTVTVTRQAGDDADLTDISLSGLPAVTGFAAGTLAYTVNIPYGPTSTLVTVVKSDEAATAVVNGGTNPVTLTVGGSTPINIVVTAENTTTTKTYTVTLVQPAANTNANLGSLVLSTGDITFQPTITSYQAPVHTGDVVQITALPAVGATSVAIEGHTGYTYDLVIGTGDASVDIVTLAQDGTTTKTYTVDFINIDAVTEATVNFLVVDAPNGSYVAGATVQVYDATGTHIDANGATAGLDLTTDASGVASALLPPEASYSFIAFGADRAADLAQNVFVSAFGETDVTLVSQKLGMIGRPVNPPKIIGIEVSNDPDLVVTSDLNDGDIIDTSADAYLLISVVGASGVEATAWSGFGLKVDFDAVPGTFNGFDGYPLVKSELQTSGTYTGKYLSTFLIDLSGADFDVGTKDLAIVAYDVANNRVEYHMPIRFVSADGAGVDISGAVFSALVADIRAYPLSRGYFGKEDNRVMAIGQYLGNDVSYRVNVTFKLMDTQATPAPVPIRGFEVYRSADLGLTWDKIGVMNYGGLSTGATGTHSYFDTDSQLTQDVVYQYKFRAFTDKANFVDSGIVQAKLFKPFAASLEAPLNRVSVEVDNANEIGPDYSFSISNTALWSVAESDRFYFTITVRDKAGPLVYLGSFFYRFSDGLLAFQYGSGWYSLPANTYGGTAADYLDYTDGVLTLYSFVPFIGLTNRWNGAPVDYKPGVTYEWDIIGDYANGHPCWFQKAYAGGGISKTYGDAYSEGANTMNGPFEFVAVEPAL